MLPPVALVLAPATNDSEPAAPALLEPVVIVNSPALPVDPLVPVDISILPDDPLVAAPVLRSTVPEDDTPDASPDDPIATLPPTLDVLAPADTVMLPPVAAVESPALIAIEPPMPVFDEPTVNAISPLLCVPLAAPLESVIDPLEPLAELPDPTDAAPVSPLFAVFTVTLPLALEAPWPLKILTYPPFFA